MHFDLLTKNWTLAKVDNNKMEAADHATKCAKKRRPDERPDEKPAETPTKKAKEAERPREITWMENYASERDKSILKKLAEEWRNDRAEFDAYVAFRLRKFFDNEEDALAYRTVCEFAAITLGNDKLGPLTFNTILFHMCRSKDIATKTDNVVKVLYLARARWARKVVKLTINSRPYFIDPLCIKEETIKHVIEEFQNELLMN